MKLTLRKIEGLGCPADKKDAMFFDDEQRGLGIRVTSGGSKTYLAQYTFLGSKKRVPLGAVTAISLDAARKATAAILGEVALGRNPADTRAEARRQAERKVLTLDGLLRQWEVVRLAERSESYAVEAVRALRFAFGKLLDKPAADLSRETIVRTLDAMIVSGKIAMASSTAAYGRACFGWAVNRGSVALNPFNNLPREPIEKRDRVLSDAELRAIWLATEAPGSFNAIVRALILTGQRREEVAQMTWPEIAPDRTVWTLAGERTKNGSTHIIPLSPQMRALLDARGAKPSKIEREMIGADDEETNPHNLLFPGRDGPFNGFSKAKAALDAESGVINWRIHDLRRTFATGLQRLGVRLEVTEAALNHVSGTRAGIVGIYQRHDYAMEKRAALDAWGANVSAIVEGCVIESNVRPMQRSARSG